MSMKTCVSMVALGGILVISSLVVAQQAIPTYTGDREITEMVDADVGAVLELDDGLSVILPKGIDATGVFTLKKTRDRPDSSQVHPEFTRHGPTMLFDAPLKASNKPIVVGLGLKRAPRREGLKFVLAAEREGPCEGRNAKYELESGMCSHWTIVTTEYDDQNRRMVAKLMRTDGLRLQFGWMPEGAS